MPRYEGVGILDPGARGAQPDHSRDQRINCDRLRLELSAAGGKPAGTVSVLVDATSEHRGPCMNYAVDRKTGRKLRCLE